MFRYALLVALLFAGALQTSSALVMSLRGSYSISGSLSGRGTASGVLTNSSTQVRLDIKMKRGADTMRLRVRALGGGLIFIQNYYNGQPIAVGEGTFRFGNGVLLGQAPMTTLAGDGKGTFILKLNARSSTQVKAELFTPIGHLRLKLHH